MDVCVCGAQVPFMRGGAELHTENLVDALRDAGHRAELVRLPTAWDRVRVFESALAWRLVPVDGDLVIATNFPSYFVRHPRKVVWLFHQHRAAYDGAGGPWSDFGLDDDGLEAQRLLTEWDNRALEESERIYTTSGVVAERLARYNGIAGEPLAHPPPLHDRLLDLPLAATQPYVFSALRLEGNKRPELIVDALAHARDARVVVAGSGTMAEDLRARARARSVDDRLDLLGFVPDDDLVRRFAECRAVIYAPYNEDYGYVTLQAFAAGKPVITAADSGGVLEWVEDDVTGIVTDGSAAELGAAAQRLIADPALAAQLGRAGRERVADLSWKPVVEKLVGP